MSKKQYKNVYTILEKVKKGEIQSHYKEKDGLFGKINFYKKEDIIKPYLHYIDESRLDSIVNHDIRDHHKPQEFFNKFANSAAYKKLDSSKRPDWSNFYHKLQENYKKFPETLKYDIHKMYYHKIDKLDFQERSSANHARYKFLEKANNPVGKIMSENSNLKSAIFTKNTMMYYLIQMTMLEYTDPDAHQKMMNSLGGNDEEGFNQDDVNNILDKMLDNRSSKDMYDKLMDDAQNTCKAMDEAMDDDIQERMFENANKSNGEGPAGKLSPDYMRQVAARLESIKLSMGSLKEKIKHLLDKSTSFFSARKEVIYDDLFNADDISGLEDYELLHPKLRKIFAEDLMIKEHKYIGKIDVYVDVSGSMSSSCGVQNTEGQIISKIDFAKSMIAKLKQLDMLNDVYLFDTRLKKYKNDLVSISMIDCGGGTTIDVAVNNVNKTNTNSLIITDAEDRCYTYAEKAFFVGVAGANFDYFSPDIMQQYANKNQVVVFDGSRIYKVNETGHIIK